MSPGIYIFPVVAISNSPEQELLTLTVYVLSIQMELSEKVFEVVFALIPSIKGVPSPFL